MMPRYIHEHADWPRFRWQVEALGDDLADVRHRQGLLTGRMQAVGSRHAQETALEAMTDEVQRSGEIEGETLDRAQVRSSIARRLGIDIEEAGPVDDRVEGVAEVAVDATERRDAPLTPDRLYGWHAAMFPTGRGAYGRITVGAWRTDARGPMQVVSGPLGRERVHFQAPAASRVSGEMELLLDWYNGHEPIDPVLKAAQAHLWFVTVHPFDDGNGRIARTISDMSLARSEGTGRRFYSLSAQIRRERRAYYDVLEATQKGDLDVTDWMKWFVRCLRGAIESAETVVEEALSRAAFSRAVPDGALNERQRRVLAKMLGGLAGRLTTRRWAAMAGCSHDTALRDIQDLVRKGYLVEGEAGGRSTHYLLRPR